MSTRYRILWRKLFQTKVNCNYSSLSRIQLHKIPLKMSKLPCTLGFSILTLIGLEKKLSAEDELILTIKHCILFIQRNELQKAEQLLHVALRQAQQVQHQNGITYIYDVMANLALEREQYDKAKELFVAVAQRIMADGVSEDDPKVVHISAKLARVSHMKKEYTTAQLGYDWCLEKLSNIIKNDPSDANKKLLAMTEDWYGRLFLDCKKMELGLKYMKNAYNRMIELPDIEPENLVTQLNDLGTACDQVGAVDESINYFLQAIEMGKKVPDMNELSTIYVNLGRSYLKKKLIDEARKSCGFGWRLAAMSKNNEVKQEAEKCIAEIKQMT